MRHCFILCLSLAALLVAGVQIAFAQNAPIAYPAKGQSFDQQAVDEANCRQWSQQQTGVNPSQAPPEYYGNQSSSSGRPVLGGAARGAAVGAVGGAIGGDAGKGAAIGAGVGATAGLIRNNRERRQQQEAANQAAQQNQAQMSKYYQAFGACMQGRGYTVR